MASARQTNDMLKKAVSFGYTRFFGAKLEMENAISLVLLNAFGIKAGNEQGETPAKLVSYLVKLALLKIDAVSNGSQWAQCAKISEVRCPL